MTDETVPENVTVPDDAEQAGGVEPVGITLAQLWAANYEAVLPVLIGNTLSKADKQQYRLKAADVAMALAGLEARRFA